MHKVGIFTDSHYQSSTFPTRNVDIQATVDALVAAKVDALLHIGDLYDDNNGGVFPSQLATIETIFSNSGLMLIPTVGNHDLNGITVAQYLGASTIFPTADANGNYVKDVGPWRFIVINNVDTTNSNYFVAVAATITFLTDALAQARVDNKFVIVSGHCSMSQDYPGNPPVMTAGNYSFYSFNAATQRGLCEAALAAGTKVKATFCGHGHINLFRTVSGIDHYEFTTNINSGSGSAYAIAYLGDDGSLAVKGYLGQAEYGFNHPGLRSCNFKAPRA